MGVVVSSVTRTRRDLPACLKSLESPLRRARRALGGHQSLAMHLTHGPLFQKTSHLSGGGSRVQVFTS